VLLLLLLLLLLLEPGASLPSLELPLTSDALSGSPVGGSPAQAHAKMHAMSGVRVERCTRGA